MLARRGLRGGGWGNAWPTEVAEGVVAWTYDHCRTALRAKSTRLALDQGEGRRVFSVNVEQIELENDERFTVAGIARILDQTERCDV
jgi:hypothetical protein